MLVYLHCIMPSVIEPSRLPQLLFLTHQDPGAAERRGESNNIPPAPAEISVIYNETDYGQDRTSEHKTLDIIATDT